MTTTTPAIIPSTRISVPMAIPTARSHEHVQNASLACFSEDIGRRGVVGGVLAVNKCVHHIIIIVDRVQLVKLMQCTVSTQ